MSGRGCTRFITLATLLKGSNFHRLAIPENSETPTGQVTSPTPRRYMKGPNWNWDQIYLVSGAIEETVWCYYRSDHFMPTQRQTFWTMSAHWKYAICELSKVEHICLSVHPPSLMAARWPPMAAWLLDNHWGLVSRTFPGPGCILAFGYPEMPNIMNLNQLHGFWLLATRRILIHIKVTWVSVLLKQNFSSIQFSSVAQTCLTLCDPMNRSTPGLPVHHQLPENLEQCKSHWNFFLSLERQSNQITFSKT